MISGVIPLIEPLPLALLTVAWGLAVWLGLVGVQYAVRGWVNVERAQLKAGLVATACSTLIAALCVAWTLLWRV